MSNKELENYVKTEEGANLLEKYQQYLILLKKLNLDACRSSNQASTRLGNLNQMLTENTDSYLKLTGELRKVPDITKQVNAMHAKIDVLHKYLLQAELALWQLESLKGETSF
uniref:Biogenesis of lysosome-related organelles complex 1 subunit 2 n=1 Tax=Rhabditophanes sp. KR3021 TaxID=114890 RepID=A0AC35TFQ0_9BILA